MSNAFAAFPSHFSFKRPTLTHKHTEGNNLKNKIIKTFSMYGIQTHTDIHTYTYKCHKSHGSIHFYNIFQSIYCGFSLLGSIVWLFLKCEKCACYFHRSGGSLESYTRAKYICIYLYKKYVYIMYKFKIHIWLSKYMPTRWIYSGSQFDSRSPLSKNIKTQDFGLTTKDEQITFFVLIAC